MTRWRTGTIASPRCPPQPHGWLSHVFRRAPPRLMGCTPSPVARQSPVLVQGQCPRRSRGQAGAESARLAKARTARRACALRCDMDAQAAGAGRPKNKPYVLGLTGSIGMGKTTVSGVSHTTLQLTVASCCTTERQLTRECWAHAQPCSGSLASPCWTRTKCALVPLCALLRA